jgi:LmbE family N-acetylglucosaminyl deacetylase
VSSRTLMIVFAHPDDEAFGTGGTMARYAANGHDVYPVTATQVGSQSPFSETPDEIMQQPWFGQEHFILAHSTVGWPKGVETDLFTGLE